MTGNAQKTHYAREINKFAEQKALSAIQVTGKALPCHVVAVSGSIVTVRFDINSVFTLPDVTCPMSGPEYIRYPIQPGDQGVVLAIDYYLGGISGIGGGVATLTPQANLSALVFVPVSNTGANTAKNWPPVENPNAVVIYGPDGVIIRSIDKHSKVTVGKTSVVVTVGTNNLTVDANNTRTSGPLQAGNGATGNFTTTDSKAVTVVDGIITRIL
jgi:hypothetical protein